MEHFDISEFFDDEARKREGRTSSTTEEHLINQDAVIELICGIENGEYKERPYRGDNGEARIHVLNSLDKIIYDNSMVGYEFDCRRAGDPLGSEHLNYLLSLGGFQQGE